MSMNPLLRSRGVDFAHSDQSGLVPGLLDALSGASAEFGRPLGVNSGYRSEAYNKKIGGAENSFHIGGRAADIDMRGMSEADRQKLVRELTQRGVTGFITYSGMPDALHVDMRPRDPGQPPHFMHDKSAKNMAKAPGWMKEAAQAGGLALPQQAPIPPANPGSLMAYAPQATSLPPDRPMPSGAVPGGLLSLPPDRPMPSGPVAYNSLPPDRPMPGGMLAQPEMAGKPQGAGRPGEIRQGADGQMYQYAETSGMLGAQGGQGWIRVNGAQPQQPQLPSLPPPRTVLDMPVFQPAAQQFPPAPQGQQADAYGNSASINGSGNRVVTNKYGVSTAMLDDGRTAATRAPFGITGPLGMREGITPMSPPTSLGDRLPGMAKTMAGGMAGGAVGGLLGPIGSVIGAIIGRDLANGRNPLDRLNPQLRQFPNAPMQQNQFPSAPKNKSGALSGRESNLSQSEMQSISPKAASDIAAGRGGLF